MSFSLNSETLEKLAAIVGKATSYSSDSRTLESTGIFVALKGLKSDGHQYVEDLLARGRCLSAVVSQDFFDNSSSEIQSNCIPVTDTHQAHRKLAQLFRQKWNVPLVAIGGSAGKTSTKEFLRTLCETSFKLVSTKGSQNGHQGIPKTLESLREDTELAIVEVGIDQIGDMEPHAELLQPDYAVLTSIGEEHLENLKDLQTVFAEETRLFEMTLNRGGKCFAPEEDSWLVKFQGDVVRTPSLSENLSPSVAVPFRGVLEQNLCLAVEVARSVGVAEEKIQSVVSQLEIPEGRGKILSNDKGQTFVLDHYNSNPASLRAAFSEIRRKIAENPEDLYLILGEMRELGAESAQYHQQAYDLAIEMKPKGLVLIGIEFQNVQGDVLGSSVHSFQDVHSAAELCADLADKPGLFLFKGSRGVELEKLFVHFPSLTSSS